jgi:hypothetical protein
LKQIHSDDENKLVREELKDAFQDIIEIEKKLDEVEKEMKKMDLITSNDFELPPTPLIEGGKIVTLE